MAVAVFSHFRAHLRETIRACGSGRELIETGFAGDVDLASEYGISPVVPILVDDRFVDDGCTSQIVPV
jgi:2-phosphosulfolactate phosphatase